MQIQHITRSDPEKVFIICHNAEGAELAPGTCVEWDQLAVGHTSSGLSVELVDGVVNVTTGIGAKVAGVVHSTIATSGFGLLQVYGVDTVRASASLAVTSNLVVTSSINATNQGHVTEGTTTTLTSPHYMGAVVGWLIEDSANATNAVVFLDLL